MSRRANAHLRCKRCRLHESLCICALMPRIETRTRLVLVIHRYEDRKPTNTGRLATECLVNSEVVVRGHEASPSAAIVVPPGTQPVLLFPHPYAVPIEQVGTRPVTLIVPDGTWRQASKVKNRVPGLLDVPCVYVRGEPSDYRLRVDAQPTGLATIEAIARALGVLEGESVQRALERVFRTMVERTLWARGAVGNADLADPIPDGTMRHEPRKQTA
jgi:DTW domain-containing protein